MACLHINFCVKFVGICYAAPIGPFIYFFFKILQLDALCPSSQALKKALEKSMNPVDAFEEAVKVRIDYLIRSSMKVGIEYI